MSIRTIYTLRDKPQWVAEAEAEGLTLIHNAPRPLWGHAVENSWSLPFLSGRHYAAIDPEGERAAEMIRHNEQMDAAEIVYVEEGDIYARACAWYAEAMPHIWRKVQEDEAQPERARWRAHLVRSFVERLNDGKAQL